MATWRASRAIAGRPGGRGRPAPASPIPPLLDVGLQGLTFVEAVPRLIQAEILDGICHDGRSGIGCEVGSVSGDAARGPRAIMLRDRSPLGPTLQSESSEGDGVATADLPVVGLFVLLEEEELILTGRSGQHRGGTSHGRSGADERRCGSIGYSPSGFSPGTEKREGGGGLGGRNWGLSGPAPLPGG